jgi:hypothetical protein
MTYIVEKKTTVLSQQNLQSALVKNSYGTLTDHMQRAFLSPEFFGGQSLHQKTVQLIFYNRLKNNKIFASELLLHFINNSAIFNKLEALIRTDKMFQEIIGEDIFRHLPIEKDIVFFIKNFNLSRPEMTNETRKFLNFSDKSFHQNKNLLLAILFVQYAGLFLGRTVCNATADWLRARIKDMLHLNHSPMFKRNHGFIPST